MGLAVGQILVVFSSTASTIAIGPPDQTSRGAQLV
jgi:hypothetical protein